MTAPRHSARIALLALPLALTAALPAQAQTTSGGRSLSLYGRVDLAMGRYAKDVKTSEDTMSEQRDSSTARLGFRATETVNESLTAFAHLEHRFKADTGAQDGTLMWKDKAFVGLAHTTYGEIRLGHQSSPLDMRGVNGRFEAFGGDSLASNGSRGAKFVAKWDNATYYQSATFNGLAFGLAYAPKETALSKNLSGVQLDYQSGPLVLSIGQQTDASATDDWKSLALAGSYDFKVAKVMAIWAKSSDVGTNNLGEQKVLTLGVQVPAGPGQIRASHQRRQDNDALGGAKEARLGLGYQYLLTKSSSVNLSLVRHNYQKASTDNTVPMQYEVALRHNF
ncbi:porin [Ideonella livida]|uniref:Porin n=1 Tax=Ideonella livida TaxID=2707176 RepID=A0A7C9TH85_9BURK|nr:porin [Ideonella livida]NDY90280.1 porin [Ideonella livida]